MGRPGILQGGKLAGEGGDVLVETPPMEKPHRLLLAAPVAAAGEEPPLPFLAAFSFTFVGK